MCDTNGIMLLPNFKGRNKKSIGLLHKINDNPNGIISYYLYDMV
jgi:hypothetical protein